MNRAWIAAPTLALLVAFAGCGSGGSGSGSASPPAAQGGVAGSKYDAGPRAAATPANAELAEHGKELFSTKGCTACHALGKRLTGPDLAGVSQRRTAVWIEHQILHPDVMTKEDPISHELLAKFALQMPNQGLTPDEAKAVIEYFKQHDQGSGDPAGPDDK
ncbi:MAG: cytochrome c [Candidatus Eisenbacteria bacterium]